MNIVLWVVQVVAGLAFLGAGSMKASQPKPKLAPNMPWVNDFSDTQVRGIGVLEILGGLGLILPGITRIAPWLVPLAAAGLIIIMVGAALYHARKHEYSGMVPSLVLLLLAAFVLYGRWIVAPI